MMGLARIAHHVDSFFQLMKGDMEKHFYFAYGLCISSELCLPELPLANRPVDVEITLGKLDRSHVSCSNDRSGFYVIGPCIYRYYKNVGAFKIDGGHNIVVDPDPEVDERILRSFLLGNIMCAMLHQRGLLALHGSAIAIDGKAVAFLGQSGSGKSSIAISFMKKGCTGMADDLVAVGVSNLPMVFPAFPQFKLPQDVAESLGYDQKNLSCISPQESKYAVGPDQNRFLLDALPLGRIYLLEKGDTMQIERLNKQESMIELIRNSRAVDSLCAGDKLQSHFHQCAKVAEDIPMRRLIRPNDLNSFGDLIQMIEKDIRSS